MVISTPHPPQDALGPIRVSETLAALPSRAPPAPTPSCKECRMAGIDSGDSPEIIDTRVLKNMRLTNK
eukprot:1395081-Amorphochlora_amoeboformis.AAC.1